MLVFNPVEVIIKGNKSMQLDEEEKLLSLNVSRMSHQVQTKIIDNLYLTSPLKKADVSKSAVIQAKNK